MKIIFSVEDIYVIEPLGLMYMISKAKLLGHQCYFSTYQDGGLMNLVKKVNPDLVAISIMSISDMSCRNVISQIKKYNRHIFVIVGGPHPTYYPNFIKDSQADAVCVGEGDGAFTDLLVALEKGKKIEGIANINTSRSINPPRPLIGDLDGLVFPDRDLVYQNSRMGEMKLKSFMATRGCPYACSYCFNSAFIKLYEHKGMPWRQRSVDNLLEEIEWVQANYPLEMIRFGDDNFVVGTNGWFWEFVEKYSKRIRLPFYCLIRPNVVTDKMARGLKKAGCVSVATSIETGNEVLRQSILSRRITDEQIVNACRFFERNGINTFTNIMVGLPGTTLKDEFKSLDLAFRSHTVRASFTIFTPFPGTDLHSYCLKKGYIPRTKKPVFPRSTTDRSMLNCFSEREKNIQRNIMLLGPLANSSRWLRGIILKILIYLPPNRIFFYLSFLVGNYLNYRYIWPIPLGAREFVRMVGVVRRHDRRYIE